MNGKEQALLLKNEGLPASTESGNALIYVLIALTLFGFLTVTLARQNMQSENMDLIDERVELYVSEMIEYVASTQQAVDMMLTSGSSVAQLDFTLPEESDFNDDPVYQKVFHPQGGGLNYQRVPSEEILADPAEGGWLFQTGTNVQWSPSSAPDVIITTNNVRREICEKLNLEIKGDAAIPVLSGSAENYFDPGGANNDLAVSDCAECEGYSSLCVQESADNTFAFYNVIVAQ
jgi:hypothetical protein